MSHELVLVIIPSATPASGIEDVVNALIRPHSNLDDHDKYPYRCDGWTIGGRFDGQIYGAPPETNLTPAEFQKRYGLDVVQPEPNIRLINQVPISFLPEIDSVVTPEGIWSSRFDDEFQGKAGEWLKFIKSKVEKYKSYTAVVIDAHS